MAAISHVSTRRIRVLRVITRLNIGGPAIHATLLSTRLDPERFETLLVSGVESPTEGNMLELGRLDRPASLRVVPWLGREISPLDDVRALSALVRIARDFRPDIVHTHLAKAGTLGRLAGRLAGPQAVIHTYHGTVFEGYFSPLKSRVILGIERALARFTTRIVAITPGQRRDLLRLGIGDERTVVEIPLGLELEPLLVPVDARAARAALGLPHDVPIVAIVARLVPVKDILTFLRAMALVPSPAVAVVVGEEVASERIVATLNEAKPPHVDEIRLFDVYKDAAIGSGKKSVAILVLMQDTARTLTDAEIDGTVADLLRVLQERFGATLRQ